MSWNHNYQEVRAVVGSAPVTVQSGKTCYVKRRMTCSNRLRQAFHHAANMARRSVGRWNDVYVEMCRRGLKHSRALRGIADRMLRGLIAMLKNRTLFDPNRIGQLHSGN
jgi:hypothetical protein